MEKQQKTRYLTVSSCLERSSEMPFLRLKGKWLNGCGFPISAPVEVRAEQGKLTIVLDSSREERIQKAEIAALERKLKELKSMEEDRDNYHG